MAGNSSKPEHFLAGKKIIVAGAGIAGLSFVIALRKQWSALTSDPASSSLDPITITVYERDSEEVAIEREGYSLTIRSDAYSGGMQALSKLGLLEPVIRASINGSKKDGLGGGFVMWDKDWNEVLTLKERGIEEADDGYPIDFSLPRSMRVSRKALRKILIDAVGESDIILWETSCLGASKRSDGKMEVHCSNGEVDECDILIAADGANSKIRASLRPNDKLLFAGAVCIAGDAKFPFPEGEGGPEPVNRDWGIVLGGGGIGLFVSPVDENRAIWSVSYLSLEPREPLKPMEPMQTISTYDPRLARELLIREALDLGRRFAQPFQSLVEATDRSTLADLEAKEKEKSHVKNGDKECEPVVFIGDSNPTMSPFAGNGANMALMDGWELAEKLCKSSSLFEALKEYDAVPRSPTALGRRGKPQSTIRVSHQSIALAHAQGWKLTFYVFFLRIVNYFVTKSTNPFDILNYGSEALKE